MRSQSRADEGVRSEHMDRPRDGGVPAVAARAPRGWARADRLPRPIRRAQLLVVYRPVGQPLSEAIVLAGSERSGRDRRPRAGRWIAPAEVAEPARVPGAPGRQEPVRGEPGRRPSPRAAESEDLERGSS